MDSFDFYPLVGTSACPSADVSEIATVMPSRGMQAVRLPTDD